MRQRSKGWSRVVGLGLATALSIGASAPTADANGTWKWKWTYERAGRKGGTVEFTLKLVQDGGKLRGYVVQDRGSGAPIAEGKVEGDSISIKVKRVLGLAEMDQTFHGKLTGDTIKGEIKTYVDGEVQTRKWEAKREAEDPR